MERTRNMSADDEKQNEEIMRRKAAIRSFDLEAKQWRMFRAYIEAGDYDHL